MFTLAANRVWPAGLQELIRQNGDKAPLPEADEYYGSASQQQYDTVKHYSM